MQGSAFPQNDIGRNFKPEVHNIIKLTLAFAKAVGNHQNDKQDNLLVSPYNALSCLSMVAKGSAGKTRAEMAKALFGTTAKNLDSEIGKLAALNDAVLAANKDQVTLKTANAVWTNQAYVPLSAKYADGLKKQFGAEISGEDFTAEKTLKKMNGWANDNTNGLIDKILEELNPEDFAVLASALYFKGKWTNPFDKKKTADKIYTGDNAAPALTPMMRKDIREEGQITYQKGGDYQAVALTYGETDYEKGLYPTMRLILVRPDDHLSARDWLAAQANGAIPAWLEPQAYGDAVGSIEVPRMDMKNKYNLVEPLKDMGIKSAFVRGKADLGPMTDGKARLHISDVTQDTVFKTDEEGSEAAAVTTAIIGITCVRMPPPRIDVKLDRSFVLALQDIQTGTVLFVGAVNKPNNDMKTDPKICP